MAKEPASIRYKNPGAMWGSALAVKWGAEKKAVALNDGTGQGNNIAIFPTYVQGICAQLDLWRSSKNYKNKRFADAIKVWSGGNNVESYIKFVLARVPGMTRDTIMNDAFWKSPKGIAFLKAQAWHEAGKPYPAPDADWIEAQRIVFGGAAPLPPPPDVEPVPEPAPVPWYKRLWIWISGTALGGSLGGGGVATGWDWHLFFAVAGSAVVIGMILFAIALWLFGKDNVAGWIKGKLP